MNVRKTLAVAGIAMLAALISLPQAAPAAQEVVQDEGAFYRAFHEASQAGDTAKAIDAAKAYLEKYPSGQYAEVIKKWLAPAELDLAVKERRTADMITLGRGLLANNPEPLTLLYMLAFNIRRNELVAQPQNLQNVETAAEFAKQASTLIEAGNTPAGVQAFDKQAALGWLTQILAIAEQKNGSVDSAIALYEKSAALSPNDTSLVGRNLLSIFMLRQPQYTSAAKAYKAALEATGEPKPDPQPLRDSFNATADTLIDISARFTAFAKVKNLPPSAIRDRVDQTLKAAYGSRFPDDSAQAGLAKILQEKEAALGGAAAPTN